MRTSSRPVLRSPGDYRQSRSAKIVSYADLEMDNGKVTTQIEAARNLYAKVAGHKLSEADTKAFFIEPLLAVLGWPMQDPSQIRREVAVYDGTLLDYALLDASSGKPAIFVEAKALQKSLDDSKFIAQAVNYANNEGVRWCVLTNGTVYRIYRTSEPVPMERKMLLEVDLLEEDRDSEDLTRSLGALSRDFVCQGELEAWGQSKFNDVKVREALRSLYTKPTPTFLNAIRKTLPGETKIGKVELIESLQRLGKHLQVPKAVPPERSPSKVGTAKAAQTPQEPWTLQHHLGGKPTHIVDLYEKLHDEIMSLGDDVTQTFSKFYVNYSARKSFTTVQVAKGQIKIYISIAPDEGSYPDPALFRDVRKIGHYGMGDLEARYTDVAALSNIMPLIQKAYEKNR